MAGKKKLRRKIEKLEKKLLKFSGMSDPQPVFRAHSFLSTTGTEPLGDDRIHLEMCKLMGETIAREMYYQKVLRFDRLDRDRGVVAASVMFSLGRMG